MDTSAGMTWQIDFWDVGQGDASCIRLPSGQYILIDAGPTPKAGNPLVQWFARPPRKDIKAVAITHNDWDHVGGLLSLAGNPDQTIHSVFFVHDKSAALLPVRMQAMVSVLKQRADAGRTATHTLERDRTIHEDDLYRLAVRHPSALDMTGVQPNNRVSAIIVLEHKASGRSVVVWGGDASLATIAEKCHDAAPVVMVGPHHGCPQDKPNATRTFTTALDSVRPRCLFISIGMGNRYGHPNSKYIKSAANLGAQICCSEVTHQCADAERITTSVFQGSGRLGYPVPPRTKQCRGTMRIHASAAGVFHDENQALFVQRVTKFTRALCSQMQSVNPVRCASQ